ncbi:hypothetical protein EZS27_004718 [termite gut metagenome]|uniref:Uncharacterized protein n=1 Tax=termite gut metagenome TaxID=433724 RepID=A0A5J4SR53_9ZZZZ
MIEYKIKVREQQTIVAGNFADYNRQMDAIRSTMHPGETLIETTRVIGIAVIMTTEPSKKSNKLNKI